MKIHFHCERFEDRIQPVSPFTVVLLPDTQHYSEMYPDTFNAQTQWIVDNKVSQNIVFATQAGDIVHHAETLPNDNAVEWARADTAFDKLDGVIPYSVSLGNHDYGQVSNRSAGSARYLEYFGPDRYRARTWYGGASPTGVNHYQYFTGGGRTFMHISFQWEPTDADFAWAQTVLDANPGIPTMITTHKYMNDSVQGHDTAIDEPDGNSGLDIFNEFVKPNAQVFMVMNGHYCGEYRQTSTNNAGLPVFEMVVDYQCRPNGGDGWLRTIQFDPDQGKINVKSYSPTLNQFETDGNSQFTWSIDFNARFGPVSPPAPIGPVFSKTFRYGEAGYTGTVDTRLRQNAPNSASGTLTSEILVDAASPGEDNASHALIRFDNIIGNGAIPANAVILNAELVVQSINEGDGGSLHRNLATFSRNDTWNSRGSGIQANNVEARSTYEAAAGQPSLTPNLPVGSLRFNVTRDVQAWASGEANHGWVILPWANATNGWGFAPSEVTAINERPMLKVEWALPAATLSSFQQGVGYSGTLDTALAQNEPTTPQNAESLVTVDGPTDDTTRHGLLRFDSIQGTAAGLIPAYAKIQWARLYLTTPYRDSNASGAGAMMHRARMNWTHADTWANSFGGNGLQADGIEIASTASLNTGNVSFGSQGFDVTSSVQAWADGETNRGWGMLPNSSDAWLFASSEATLIGERPRLVASWDARPVVTSIDSLSANGSYATGQTVNITLHFSENVQLLGTLRITLDTGAILIATAFNGTTLTVPYTIQAGQSSPDLNVTNIVLGANSALRDAAGTDAALVLPLSNLADNANLIINPPPPSTSFSVNLSAPQRSRLTRIDLNFSAPINAAILGAPGGITLTRTTPNDAVQVDVSSGLILSSTTGMVTDLIMTFANISTPSLNYGSLADGRWRISIPSLNYQSTLGDPALRRLFGDNDANGTVDASDFAAFGGFFGQTVNNPFDFNNDGAILADDLAEFGNRFGITL